MGLGEGPSGSQEQDTLSLPGLSREGVEQTIMFNSAKLLMARRTEAQANRLDPAGVDRHSIFVARCDAERDRGKVKHDSELLDRVAPMDDGITWGEVFEQRADAIEMLIGGSRSDTAPSEQAAS